MNNEIQLKPCPFCGGQASIHQLYFPNDYYTVVCDSCGAMIYNNYNSVEAASEVWNEREKTERKHGKWLYNENEGMFYCSECGEEVVYKIYKYCMWCGAKMDGG